MSKTTYCGECEHFDPDYDPYGLFDGYCDLYERGRNKNSESVTHPHTKGMSL